MSFDIFTDTSANLPLAIAQEKGLSVIPFSYITPEGQKRCLDPEDFDGDAFYSQIKQGVEVSTSQVTPYQYEECFRPLLEAGRDILFVGMSSGISGSYGSACAAAAALREDFPQRRIELVDTLAASLGEGIVALKAAAYKALGLELEAAAELLRRMSKRMCQVFTVDDLMHLKRGGRLSNLSAIVGTVLNIKPILIGNEEGKIVAVKKIRGRKHSIKALAEAFVTYADAPREQLVGIAQAGCREDAEALKELLLAAPQPPKEILTVQYEPVTGAHVGPGALALFFLSDDQVRTNIQK